MAHVTFTRHLQRFFPTLAECDVAATNVRELIEGLERMHPGISSYLVDDTGRLRRHVNVFVNSEPIYDRQALTDALTPEAEVFIVQALSGG